MIGALVISLAADVSAVNAAFQQVKSQMASLASVAQQTAAVSAGAFAAIGAAVVSTVSKFGEFEAQLNQIAAVSDAAANQIEALGNQALEMGSKGRYGAIQVAMGMTELSKAGFTAKQTMDAIPGVLALAAAGGVSIAQAAELAGGSLRGFGLAASQTMEIANTMAKAANLSAISITDLQYSLKYIAPVAQTAGQSMHEITAMLALLGNSMIKGEQAGTSLRQILIRLSDPPKDAAKALEKLGITLQDTHGHMLPLSEIIGQLRDKTASMTDAQKTATLSNIAGTTALSAFATLIKTSSKDIDDMRLSILNNSGAADEMSDKMNRGILVSFEKLKNAVESLGIKLGKEFSPAAKPVIEFGETVIKMVGQVDPAFIRLGVALTATAAVFLGGLAVMSAAIVALTAVVLPAMIALAAFSSILGFSILPAILGLIVPLGLLATAVGVATLANTGFSESANDAATRAVTQTKSLQDLVKEFNRLQMAVAPTVEEKRRLKVVTDQLVAISPALISGWDAQGNAISVLKSEVDRLTKSFAANAAEAIKAAKAAALVVRTQWEDAKSRYKTQLEASTALNKQQAKVPEVRNRVIWRSGGMNDPLVQDYVAHPKEMYKGALSAVNQEIPKVKSEVDSASARLIQLNRRIDQAEAMLGKQTVINYNEPLRRLPKTTPGKQFTSPDSGKSSSSSHKPHLTEEQKQVLKLAEAYKEYGQAVDAASNKLNLHKNGEKWAKEVVAAQDNVLQRVAGLGEKQEKINQLLSEQEGVYTYEMVAKAINDASAAQQDYDNTLRKAELIFSVTGDEAELLATKLQAAEKQFNSLAESQSKLPKDLYNKKILEESLAKVTEAAKNKDDYKHVKDAEKALQNMSKALNVAELDWQRNGDAVKKSSAEVKAIEDALVAVELAFGKNSAAAATLRQMLNFKEGEEQINRINKSLQELDKQFKLDSLSAVTGKLTEMGAISSNAAQGLGSIAKSALDAASATDAVSKATAIAAGEYAGLLAILKMALDVAERLWKTMTRETKEKAAVRISNATNMANNAYDYINDSGNPGIDPNVIRSLGLKPDKEALLLSSTAKSADWLNGKIDILKSKIQELKKEGYTESSADVQSALMGIAAYEQGLAAIKEATELADEASKNFQNTLANYPTKVKVTPIVQATDAAADAEEARKRGVSVSDLQRAVNVEARMGTYYGGPRSEDRFPIKQETYLEAMYKTLPIAEWKKLRDELEQVTRSSSNLEDRISRLPPALQETYKSMKSGGVGADFLSQMLDDMADNAAKRAAKAEAELQAFKQRVENFSAPIASSIGKTIEDALNSASFDFSTFELNLMQTMRSAVVSAVTEAFSSSLIMPYLQPILTTLTASIEYISKASSDAVRKSRMNDVLGIIPSLGAAAKNILQEYAPLIDSARSIINSTFGMPSNLAAAGGSSGLSQSLNAGNGWLLPYAVNGQAPNLAQFKIPALASGGIVDKPTVALIGEAGPEAVVPLGSTGNTFNITVNVEGNSGDPRALVEEMIRQIRLRGGKF